VSIDGNVFGLENIGLDLKRVVLQVITSGSEGSSGAVVVGLHQENVIGLDFP
jgi:hypothetical protein